jgi:hypothetical protein
MKEGALEAALRLTLGILYGSAKNMTEHHRLMKKKRKMDKLSEFA